MYRNFFKFLLIGLFMFGASDGFSNAKIDKLYEGKLYPTYEMMKPQQDAAKKRKTIYIISAILAVVLLLTFIKYFKMMGLIVSIVMIFAGYYVLSKSSDIVTNYEKNFKTHIISKIGENCCGFRYVDTKIDAKEFRDSDIVLALIDQFRSDDVYENDLAKFTYIDVNFKTKESRSVERLNENRFSGYFIIIKKPNTKEGVLVSDLLRDKVANMDIEMASFFANAKRDKKVGNFTLYGNLDQSYIDRVLNLGDKLVAVSFKKDATYVILYKMNNPLSVSVLKDFNIQDARGYENAFKEVNSIIEQLYK